jgi:hypothetical protein
MLIFQAILEHGIPETPEMVVALMQKVGYIYNSLYPCTVSSILYVVSILLIVVSALSFCVCLRGQNLYYISIPSILAPSQGSASSVCLGFNSLKAVS